MKKNNGFTEADIIATLRLGIDLAGDGGCSPWRDGEYEACIEYLDELKRRLESKYSVECCECDTIVNHTDNDLHFSAMLRLMDLLMRSNDVDKKRMIGYTKKLIESLNREGYVVEAKIVGDCLIEMETGKKRNYAVMDETIK